jgi:hypothetical protein
MRCGRDYIDFAGVLEDGFEKSGLQYVVFGWLVCGGMRGEAGERMRTFLPTKFAPHFSDLFFDWLESGSLVGIGWFWTSNGYNRRDDSAGCAIGNADEC